jgi:hypothetical protein
MFNNKLKIVSVALIALMAITATSCTDDLNTSPIDKDVQTSESVYTSPENYRQVLAKLYAGFATTGQQGPAGDADIQGIDEGFSSYIRQLWVAQEISTDLAVVGWNDDGLPEYNYHEWNSSNDFVMALYSRIYYQIALANEFIRNAQGNDNQQVQQYLAEARFLRALSYWHALDMFGGGVPFVTEDDPVGAYQPEPIGAQELFNYIESELTEIESEMAAPGSNEYGRADQGAVWTLLTKLYINAEVYIDQARYDDAITYANKVINEGGYSLDDNYSHLFMADNHTADGLIFSIPFDGVNTQTFGGTTFIAHAAVGGDMNAGNFGLDGGWAGNRVTPQFVNKFQENSTFPGYQNQNNSNYDEIYVPGSYQSESDYGSDWTPADAPRLVSYSDDSVFTGHVYIGEDGGEFKFTEERNFNTAYGINDDGELDTSGDNLSIELPAGMYEFRIDLSYDANANEKTKTVTYNRDRNFDDSRDMFFTYNQSNEISELPEFRNGFAVSKWKNITQSGQSGSDLTFVDIDFPMFRIADVYLMYAEAVVRRDGGANQKALNLVNDLRERAYGDLSGNINMTELDLPFILDERARELYWEGHRRTDLRRYGLFTGSDYNWAWKGRTPEGSATDEKYEIFPIPASDINSNLNLEQNPGY